MNDIQNIYDENSNRAQLAYMAFRAVHEKMFPPPTPPEIKKFGFGPKQWAMFAALVGAVIVSASHSVPVFLGKASISEVEGIEFLIAASIFLMAEAGLITFAYSYTENSATPETIGKVNIFTNIGMWFIAIILILANVYYTLEHRTDIEIQFRDIWGLSKVVIFLLIGASAPIIALIVGEILAVDVLRHKNQIRRELQAYEQRLAEWTEGMNFKWAKVKSRWDGDINIEVSRPTPTPVYLSTDSRQTRPRSSDAIDTAYQWLVDNPDMQAKSLRELAPLIGVGKDSINAAKKRLQDRQ